MTKNRNVIKRKKYVPPVFEMILVDSQEIIAGSIKFDAETEHQGAGESGSGWGNDAKGLLSGFTSFNLIEDDYDAIDELVESLH